MPKRNQRKKSLEGSGKCKVNASDMLHCSNCGNIAFLLLLRSQQLLMSTKHSALDTMQAVALEGRPTSAGILDYTAHTTKKGENTNVD